MTNHILVGTSRRGRFTGCWPQRSLAPLESLLLRMMTACSSKRICCSVDSRFLLVLRMKWGVVDTLYARFGSF